MPDGPTVLVPDDAEIDGVAPDTAEPDGMAGVPVTSVSSSIDLNALVVHRGDIGVQLNRLRSLIVNGQAGVGPDTASAFAALTRPDNAITVGDYLQGLVDLRDTCTRYEQGIAVEGHLANLPEQGSLSFLDGGQVLTMTGPAGSYAELTMSQSSAQVGYASRDLLPVPAPDDLLADIPGADFPMVADIRIPPMQPLNVPGPAPTDMLSPAFSWEAGRDPSSPLALVKLGVTTTTADGAVGTVLCAAIDDGEFTMPAWATTSLQPGSSVARSVQRENLALTQSGTTLVVGASLSQHSWIEVGAP